MSWGLNVTVQAITVPGQRDRDLLRQQVLMKMGWKIYRVWSTEWFHDRDTAIESILQSLERAQETPPEQLVEAPPITEQPDSQREEVPVSKVFQAPAIRRYPPGQPYQKFRADSTWRSTEILLKPANVPLLAKLVVEIVTKEGPVHQRLIIDRLKETFGIDEIAAESNAAANIVKAIDSAVRNYGLSQGRSGWFIFRDKDSLGRFRVPGDGVLRPLTLIAPEEIAAAILHLIEDQVGMIRDKIPQSVGVLLGVNRVSAEAAGIIDQVVDELVDRGALRASGASLCLAQ